MRANSTILHPSAKSVVNEATTLTRARYQRISPIYDKIEWLMEKRLRPWRKKLWQAVRGPEVLEVGVGTGKNIEYWPLNSEITAIDLTPGMLDIARRRASRLDWDVDLRLGDVQSLEFPSSSFDTVVATFVFCSVPDPVQGLREIARVVRPGGQILLLEHVGLISLSLAASWMLWLHSLFDSMAPISIAGRWRMFVRPGCRLTESRIWMTWACSS